MLSLLLSPILSVVRTTNLLLAFGVAGIAINTLVGERAMHFNATLRPSDTLYGLGLAWLAVSLLVQALGWCNTNTSQQSQQGKRG
jgi:hypothetical protein